MEGIRGTFWGISLAMPLAVIQMIVFSNQVLLAVSLYDLRCVILTIRKQIIEFEKGTFAPPAPQLIGRRAPAPSCPPSPACLIIHVPTIYGHLSALKICQQAKQICRQAKSLGMRRPHTPIVMPLVPNQAVGIIQLFYLI